MWSLSQDFGDVQSAISSGTFDPTGQNYTTFGAPTFPTLPKLDMGTAATIASAGAAAAAGDPLPAIAAVAGSAASGSGSSASGDTTGVAATAGNILIRAAVIVLGFIFVAAGLVMFRSPIVVRSPVAS